MLRMAFFIAPLNDFFDFFHLFPSTALLVLLAAAAGAGIVGIDLDIGALGRGLGQGIVLVGEIGRAHV